MDIDSIIKYKRPKESFYDILGCHQSSTLEQINCEYKTRALQLHPDKNPNPESAEKFQLLQIAKNTLTDEISRKSYDTWLNSGIQIPFEQWQCRKGHSMHWAHPKQTNLSIKGNDSLLRQGNDTKVNASDSSRVIANGSDNSVLEKFRRYEI